jgi:Tol biopolymer transport system component
MPCRGPEVLGDPVPVAETVRMTSALQSLVWMDRRGREEPINPPARIYGVPRLSPDGTRVVLNIWDPDADLWIWDLARDRGTRLTSDPGNDLSPVWTPDGRRVIFTSSREQASVYNLYSVATDGTGTVERLTTTTHWRHPTSMTPDGTRILAYESIPDGPIQIIMIPLMHPSKAERLFHSPFSAIHPEVSPNGRYVAYNSNLSGVGVPDVYVRPFPDVERGV